MFQILAVIALDQDMGTKTLLTEIYVTRSIFRNKISFESLTLRRFFSTLHVLDSPRYSNLRFLAQN